MLDQRSLKLEKDQDFMVGLPLNAIDDYKYGMQYIKRTMLWSNIDPCARRTAIA